MAFLGVIINVIALIVGGGNPVTIISLIAAIWAAGIADNFMAHPQDIPNYAALLGIGSFIVGIIMLIVGATS